MMAVWLRENLATILVGLVLFFAVVIVIRQLIRDRKRGKSSCCGRCAGCPLGQTCKESGKTPDSD